MTASHAGVAVGIQLAKACSAAMAPSRFNQASRSSGGPHPLLRSAAAEARTAAAHVLAYLCGLATIVLVAALVLAACPPDLSSIIDSINKTSGYDPSDGSRAALTDGARQTADAAADREAAAMPAVAAPDTTAKAPTAARRQVVRPCPSHRMPGPADSRPGSCTIATAADWVGSGDAPQLRGRL